MKPSAKQTEFINEARHLGIEARIVDLPKECVLILVHPDVDSRAEIVIRASQGKAVGSHVNTARLEPNFGVEYGRGISLKEAGHTMLEWVGR